MDMNSESRTSSQVNIINNSQFNFISRTRQLIRRCSFCRSDTHNVSNCNDDRLVNFNQTLQDKRDELQYIQDAVDYFKIWLFSLDPELIKAYAVRYCHVNTRTPHENCVIKIIQHIWLAEINVNIPNQISINDYIPFIQETIRDYNIDYLDLRLSAVLNAIESLEEEASENKKHKIEVTLCVEIETENTHSKDVEQPTDCSICYNEIKKFDMVTLNCNHSFCVTCVKKTLTTCKTDKTPCCALCRGEISKFNIKNPEVLNNLKENLA